MIRRALLDSDVLSALMKHNADILIAATAIDAGLDLVSNNASHFSRVAGLNVVSWTN